jgi:hypothetical protein
MSGSHIKHINSFIQAGGFSCALTLPVKPASRRASGNSGDIPWTMPCQGLADARIDGSCLTGSPLNFSREN